MDIGLIAINYNSTAHTKNLIDCFLASRTSSRMKLFIVDNSPTLQSFDEICSIYQNQICIIQNISSPLQRQQTSIYLWKSEENLGFARANNVAFKKLKWCDFIVVINNDIIFHENFLDLLIKFSITTDAWCTSTVLLKGNSNDIWYAGGRNSVEPFFRKRHLHSGQAFVEAHENISCNFASGALFCLNMSRFDEDYIFNEHYFFGEEDSEFFLRMSKKIRQDIVVNRVLYARHMIGQSRNTQNYYWRISQAINSKLRLYFDYSGSKILGIILSLGYVTALFLLIIPSKYFNKISFHEYYKCIRVSFNVIFDKLRSHRMENIHNHMFSEKILK